MQKLFAYPIKPHILNQAWGVLAPEIYQQFGFTRHNGLDHRIIDSDGYAYAPFDYEVIGTAYHPTGGGNELYIISAPIAFEAFRCTTPDGKTVIFAPGTYRVRVDFLHNEKFIAPVGQKGKTGDRVVKCDNTGFSTGPHCHTQWRRVYDQPGYPHADTNDANNSFDPTQFFDGVYAVDYQQTVSLLRQAIEILKRILGAVDR
jgi:murein DD-endopeptidase MepM/ murein hydrolase activator NlpD